MFGVFYSPGVSLRRREVEVQRPVGEVVNAATTILKVTISFVGVSNIEYNLQQL